jgi:hypothetical protein
MGLRPIYLLAYWASAHDTVGLNPASLVLGMQLRLLCDLLSGASPDKDRLTIHHAASSVYPFADIHNYASAWSWPMTGWKFITADWPNVRDTTKTTCGSIAQAYNPLGRDLPRSHSDERCCAQAPTDPEANCRFHKHSPLKIWNGSMYVGFSGRAGSRRERCGIFAETRFVKPAKNRYYVTTGKQAMSSLQPLLRASRVKQHVTMCFLRGLLQSIWTVRWEEREHGIIGHCWCVLVNCEIAIEL